MTDAPPTKRFIYKVYAEWAKTLPDADSVIASFLGSYGARLYVHDMSHIVAGSDFCLQGEEAAAIVQSVLMRDTSIRLSRDARYPEGARAVPGFDALDKSFFRRIKEYSDYSWKLLNPKDCLPKDKEIPLSDEGRRFYYDLAATFDRVFEENFGKSFHVHAPDELERLNPEKFIGCVRAVWREMNHAPTNKLANAFRSMADARVNRVYAALAVLDTNQNVCLPK